MNQFDDLLTNVPANQDGGAQLSKEDYAAKKQDEREAVFALSDQAAMDVAGSGGRFQQYLNVQSRFHRYSTVNTLLILNQKPEATRVADFDNWKRMGGSVKQGQTAISILEPHDYTKGDGTPGTGYNVKKVFDVSQVDTRKIKSMTTLPPTHTERQLLKALISNAPVSISGVDDLPGDLGAMYDPQTDSISVRRGMEFADTFRSVAQELAVADLTTGPDTQADPQFSAYCASYLLCKKFGVDTKGFDFADAPSALKDMDAHAVKGELSQIRDVAGDISGRMSRQLEAVSRAARAQEAR